MGIVAVAALLAVVAAPAAAQSKSGGYHVTKKAVIGYITKKVIDADVHHAVSPVFPNARFEQFNRDEDLIVNCFNTDMDKYYGGGPMWACYYYIWLWEKNRDDPSQWTLRSCEVPDDGDEGRSLAKSSLLYVQRGKHSRKLRIRGNWRIRCPIDQFAIDTWNEKGEDYDPTISSEDAVPYKAVESDNDFIDTSMDLGTPPSGAPGPPPGPLGGGPPVSGKAMRGWYETGCNPRAYPMQFSTGTFYVYSCFWAEQQPLGIPGTSPSIGVFAQETYYRSWYWTGNYYGNDIWRWFQEGRGNGPHYA